MKEKIIIIIGHYGSGKSEFALNYAMKHALYEEVCLADLDIINTYFRSREERANLEKLGIEIIADTLDSTKGLDMPYLSPAIQGCLARGEKLVILDCGGDDIGLRVLHQFKDLIKERNYCMLMIVNVFRPETSNSVQIIQMLKRLETEIGLKVSGFVNNSNFLKTTKVEDMFNANEILNDVSKEVKIPILYVSGIDQLIEQLPDNILGKRFSLELRLREKWL